MMQLLIPPALFSARNVLVCKLDSFCSLVKLLMRGQVKKFMRKRFLPILEQLPESCDWELHVLTVTQPVIEGDPNRSSHSSKSKKLVAAAICYEAKKLNATGGSAVSSTIFCRAS